MDKVKNLNKFGSLESYRSLIFLKFDCQTSHRDVFCRLEKFRGFGELHRCCVLISYRVGLLLLAVSWLCTIDCMSVSVFRCSPELLNPEVLFYPFEEQFNTPSVSIQQWYNSADASRLFVRKMYRVPSSGFSMMSFLGSSG